MSKRENYGRRGAWKQLEVLVVCVRAWCVDVDVYALE
jgi:hypothetical protein